MGHTRRRVIPRSALLLPFRATVASSTCPSGPATLLGAHSRNGIWTSTRTFKEKAPTTRTVTGRRGACDQACMVNRTVTQRAWSIVCSSPPVRTSLAGLRAGGAWNGASRQPNTAATGNREGLAGGPRCVVVALLQTTLPLLVPQRSVLLPAHFTNQRCSPDSVMKRLL